jgi:pyridoxine 5-phosphate synthase
MMKLSVNVDHVANIREARKASEPDPVAAAIIAELAGAHGITVHLRSDRRHIQERDLYLLKQVVKGELNLEMAASAEMLNIALKLQPHWVTLVPEQPGEVTTQGGLNLLKNTDYLSVFISKLKENHIKVSVFLDPSLEQIKIAQQLSTNAVEIHTGVYAETNDHIKKNDELRAISEAAIQSNNLSLFTRAGHGLTYQNVLPIAAISYIQELSIGHSIISQSVLVGLEKAIKDMLALINK